MIVAPLVTHVARHGFWTWDTFVRSPSSASTPATGHRPATIDPPRQAHLHLIGRVQCSVLYEHFSTEHLRGHHVRVGTAEDAATAHFGESATRFLLRTVPAQFRSAWWLECTRLGDPAMRWWDRRMLRHRVVHGLVLEWTVAAAIRVALGPGAFAAYLVQAAVAVRLLEAVNYFEHWGLTRRNRRITTMDSWDTASRFTLYTLVGLSRHADHHAGRRARTSSPLLRGEPGCHMVLRHRGLPPRARGRFRQVMTAELQRCRLGPFARRRRLRRGDQDAGDPTAGSPTTLQLAPYGLRNQEHERSQRERTSPSTATTRRGPQTVRARRPAPGRASLQDLDRPRRGGHAQRSRKPAAERAIDRDARFEQHDGGTPGMILRGRRARSQPRADRHRWSAAAPDAGVRRNDPPQNRGHR